MLNLMHWITTRDRAFERIGIEIRYITSHNQRRDLPGHNDLQKYRIAKSTLIVGIRKTRKFNTSKLSAKYAILLVTRGPTSHFTNHQFFSLNIMTPVKPTNEKSTGVIKL